MREYPGGDALKPGWFVMLLDVLSPGGLAGMPRDSASRSRAELGVSVGSAPDIAAL